MCGLICLHHFKTSNAKYITLCYLKCASVLNVLKADMGNKVQKLALTGLQQISWCHGEWIKKLSLVMELQQARFCL